LLVRGGEFLLGSGGRVLCRWWIVVKTNVLGEFLWESFVSTPNGGRALSLIRRSKTSAPLKAAASRYETQKPSQKENQGNPRGKDNEVPPILNYNKQPKGKKNHPDPTPGKIQGPFPHREKNKEILTRRPKGTDSRGNRRLQKKPNRSASPRKKDISIFEIQHLCFISKEG